MSIKVIDVTDDEIRALLVPARSELCGKLPGSMTYDIMLRLNSQQYSALVAIGERRARRGDSRSKARARCAAAIAARKAGGS